MDQHDFERLSEAIQELIKKFNLQYLLKVKKKKE